MRNLSVVKLLAPYKKKISVIFSAILVLNLLVLVLPWSVKLIIDTVIVQGNYYILNLTILGLMLTFLGKWFFGYKKEYESRSLGERIVCDIRRDLYQHTQQLSFKSLENTSVGEVLSRILGDVDTIKKFFFGGALDVLYSFLTLCFVVIVLVCLDWRLAILATLFLPLFGMSYVKFSVRLKSRHKILRQKVGHLSSRLAEVIQGMKIVRGFGQNQNETERFEKDQKDIQKTALETHALDTGLLGGAEFVASLCIALLLWFGARAVIGGRITPGTLMAFYSYLGLIFMPVIRLVTINSAYQEAKASLERINEFLAEDCDAFENQTGKILKHIRGEIVFDQVSFSYRNDQEVLANINFRVEPGSIVAIVGPSGTGKSTLINLLMRFYDPTSGRIIVDGYDLRDLDVHAYRQRLALVLQEDFLFNETIRENILYGNPDAKEGDIVNAAQMAHAHDFIMEFPDQYDTLVGATGAKLSGGERKRVSIARALLRNPDVLILDEPTSFLDRKAETKVKEGLRNLMKDRTTIIVSHHLAAFADAQKIIVIENGQIVEEGAHEELLNKNGLYRRLFHKEDQIGVA